jgi:methyl-accepting chemotaxis protein
LLVNNAAPLRGIVALGAAGHPGHQQVMAKIADVQNGATETGSASGVLGGAGLSADSSRLKAEVSKFLDTVRAA